MPPAPISVADEIATWPEVESVGVVRSVKIDLEGGIVALAARGVVPASDASYRRSFRSLVLFDGAREAVVERLAAGEGALVNESFVRRFGKHPGDQVTLPAPSGPVRLPILATYFDPTFSNLGVVLIDLDLYRRLWNDDTLNVIEPMLRAGADVEQTAERMRLRLGEAHSASVFTLASYRKDVRARIAADFVVPMLLVAIALVIAVLGLVSFLIASLLARVREIGVLRATGATRRQIVLSIAIEASAVSALPGVMAAVLASLIAPHYVDVFFRQMWGISIFYAYPFAVAIGAVAAAVAIAALVGCLAALAATRIPPSRALLYE
jgi:putative ABC transport system permease protein